MPYTNRTYATIRKRRRTSTIIYCPALFNAYGWTVVHVDVSHAARVAGRSNYSNLQRALVGVVDLLGVMWLIRRAKRAKVTKK